MGITIGWRWDLKLSENNFDWRHDISWVNVWFAFGVILGLVLLADFIGVWDLGLYPDDILSKGLQSFTEVMGK